MKLRSLIGPAILLLTAVLMAVRVAYVAGQREMRQFQALCESPGVRCVVEFEPAYLERHSLLEIPAYTVGTIADSDGRVW